MTDASAIVTAALASPGTVATLCTGVGALLLALAFAIRVVAPALPPLAEKLAEIWRRVQSKRAQVDHERAKADHVEAQASVASVQRGIVDAETIAAALGEMATMRAEHAALHARLDESDEKHTACEATVTKLRGEVRTLRREMERRGWTPPGGFPAPEEA